MIQKFRNSFDRIRILLNLEPSSIQSLEEKHSQLIAEDFYAGFREKTDAICLKIRLDVEKCEPDTLIDCISNKDVTLATYQRLILRSLLSPNFKKSIAHALAYNVAIWFPLESSWQKELAELGIRFNRPICRLLLVILKTLTVIHSVVTLVRLRQEEKRRLSSPHFEESGSKKYKSAVFLSGFDEKNFPTEEYASHDFFSWIRQEFPVETQFVHDCYAFGNKKYRVADLHFQASIATSISKFSKFGSFLRLAKVCIKLLLTPNIRFLDTFGLIDEIWILVQILDQNIAESYSSVLFPSTKLCVKPIWANVLEQRGVKVICVHYTAMAEPLKSGLNRVVDGIWHLSSWKTSWVVDYSQVRQMKLTSPYSSSSYSIMGVPYWSGRVLDSEVKPGVKYLSAFDTHIRANTVFSAGVVDEMGWNNPKLEEVFIELILGVATELGIVVLHKKKRKVEMVYTKRFSLLSEKLHSKFGSSYVPLDENISATSMIQLSSVVVSKPISTTALVGRQLKIPSIILDPTGNTRIGDPGLRDCPLAYDYKDLKTLVQDALNSSLDH